MNDLPALGTRVREAIARGRHEADSVGPMDVAAAEELADALASATADLQAELRRPRAGDGPATAELCRRLAELTELQGGLREQVVAQRFGTVAQIHESHARLRSATTVAELLPSAAEELGRSCGFDRTAISRRRGSTWHAEAVWLAPGTDARVARATRDYLTEKWIPMRPGTVESHLVQRRSAALVSAEDPGVDPGLIDATAGSRYVASPVLSGDRVIGFLHADRFGEDRVVTDVDRDNLWTFGEGFGLLFERLALLERLDGRRDRVREAFAEAEEGLLALGSDELLLTRDDDAPPPVDHRSPGAAGGRGPVGLLTAREREVVDLMATGARNREIAERLVIGEATVKSHVRAIARKLEATSRADAVARYLRSTTEGAW